MLWVHIRTRDARADVRFVHGRAFVDSAWNEKDHPRASNGEFGEGGGGASDSPTAATLKGNELGSCSSTRELREKAVAYAARHLVNTKTRNKNSGATIEITRQGIKHAISGANDPELRLLPGLKSMLEHADYDGKEPDKANRADIKAIHKYRAKVDLGGEKLNVGIVVREMADGHKHYDHFIIKENPAGTSGGASR